MASKGTHKSKRTNLASQVTNVLRGDPKYQAFEMANLESILVNEVINKPWLTKLTTVIVESGSLTSPEERELFKETGASLKGVNVVQVEKRTKTLRELLELRRSQENLALKRSAILIRKSDQETSLKADCRLSLERLASCVAKSGCVKLVDLDENDPDQFANGILSTLSSMQFPKLCKILSLDILSNTLSAPDGTFNDQEYKNYLLTLGSLARLLNVLEKRLKDSLSLFSNQRGGWKQDVLELIKSSECRKGEDVSETRFEDPLDLDCVEYQVSKVRLAPQILNPDELDHQILELNQLISSLRAI